ncbi:MAG: DUF2344 domain-containing protein [Lachnospiraceae bacterium]|nr:DUF2344 domain-containing protein [Lachnospiraceae bacterium]
MKVRLRFSKTGALVYIGHLDVMRYFQKLFRRAYIPVKYSEGFSPHQILSFTPPLPLGMESLGEYADVELTKSITSNEAMERLSRQSVPEIEILSFKELPEKCENAMASVKAARYEITGCKEDIGERISDFLSSEEVFVIKRSKKSEKMINLRPLVYELGYDPQKNVMEMLISSGSTDNIKPDLVINALYADHSEMTENNDLVIKRIDQYTMTDSFVSLDDIGQVIL